MKKQIRRYSKEEKLKVLELLKELGPEEISKHLGIPRTTICTWKSKYAAEGEEGLINKSGGHNKGKRQIEAWKQKEVLAEKEENPGTGSSQIRNQLRRRGITISTKSINQILEEAGYEVKKLGNSAKKEWQRYEASRPLELVQTDITEFYIHKEHVYLVLLLDDFSRFLLNFKLITECNMEQIQSMVDEAIGRYGKMESILSDRGFVFHGWRGINRFEKHLDQQDIYHIHTSPHHPQTIGKIESVNKAIKKELIRQREFENILVAREAIESWIWRYNYKRVHQGLGGVLVPADRFHGWSCEVEKELSKMVEDGISISEREINLFGIRLIDSRVQLNIMGKSIELRESNGREATNRGRDSSVNQGQGSIV